MVIWLSKSILKIIADFSFPKHCLNCGKNGRYICKRCLNTRLQIRYIHKCHVCGGETRLGLVHSECKANTYLDGVVYVTLYNSFAKQLIHEAKYNLYFDILNDIGSIMFEYSKQYKFFKDGIFVPIPLHRHKKNWRGFNQSGILSKVIALKYKSKSMGLITRVAKTKTQVGMTQVQRESNVKNKFSMDMAKLAKYASENKDSNVELDLKGIILIDDVFTTGTTLNECAKVLKEYGFKRVYGFTFAKSGEKRNL
jgi:competence protein ComFC